MAIAYQYRIRLDFGSPDDVSVLDLSSLLWDLNKIFVVGFREADRAGTRGSFPSRDNYRLPDDVHLSVAQMHFGSPLVVELINHGGPAALALAAPAAMWALVQALEKTMQLGPSLRRAKADARKAELEGELTEQMVREKKRENLQKERELRQPKTEVDQMRNNLHHDDPKVVELIEGSREINRTVRRLQENPLQLHSMDIFPSTEDRF